jgi:hypothetical protein
LLDVAREIGAGVFAAAKEQAGLGDGLALDHLQGGFRDRDDAGRGKVIGDAELEGLPGDRGRNEGRAAFGGRGEVASLDLAQLGVNLVGIRQRLEVLILRRLADEGLDELMIGGGQS